MLIENEKDYCLNCGGESLYISPTTIEQSDENTKNTKINYDELNVTCTICGRNWLSVATDSKKER